MVQTMIRTILKWFRQHLHGSDNDSHNDSDNSDLRHTMIQTAEKPYLIFLSHAGEDTHVAELVYNELKRANHTIENRSVFFDKRTLRPGDILDPGILKILENVRVAVVILSENFVTKKWPMLELLTMFHASESREKNPREKNPAYPLSIIPFYLGLKPEDLNNQIKLTKWKKKWKKIAKGRSRDLINVQSCQAALRKLKKIVGLTSTATAPNQHFHLKADIVELVRSICKRVPPQVYFFPSECLLNVGYNRIEQDINGKLHSMKENSNGSAISLGVYGVAGSGKSTLCKIMVDFFVREYRRFYIQPQFLEFPDNLLDNNGKEQLITSMRVVIASLMSSRFESTDSINDVNSAVTTLTSSIQAREKDDPQVFLAIDNVCEWSLPFLIPILKAMDTGSIVIITSRNRKILERLICNEDNSNEDNIVPMPMLNDDEAWEAFLGYFFGCLDKSQILQEANLKIVTNEIYTFLDGCHPKMLLEVANRLNDKVDDMKRCLSDKEIFKSHIIKLREILFSRKDNHVKQIVQLALENHDRKIANEQLKRILSEIEILFPISIEDNIESCHRCIYICIEWLDDDEVEEDMVTLDSITYHSPLQKLQNYKKWIIGKDELVDMQDHNLSITIPVQGNGYGTIIDQYMCGKRKGYIWGIHAASHLVLWKAIDPEGDHVRNVMSSASQKNVCLRLPS